MEPHWVGRRVVIRHAVDRDESGRLRFSDTLGDLVELTAEEAVVESRRGTDRVPLGHIATAKLVEPAAAQILELEAIAARGWRAEETAEVGGWLLRANAGFTNRANSALPLRPPTRSLNATLDAAREWYAERGLPLRVTLPSHARRLLDAELAERGWPAALETHVLVRRIPVTPDAPEVHIADRPDDEWLARFRAGQVPAQARELLTRHDRLGFAELRRDGRTVAIGRGAVDEGWLGITAVEVAPELRRQGLGTVIMRALWHWAMEQHGATRSYLQVTVDNSAALAAYTRLGYWHHHDYRYRSEPAPGTP